MWRLGFFFHEMGFGLLSIFLPLYIVSIERVNGLFYLGIISAIALFSSIPASFFWGYVCDKTRRYKRYILLSFFASTMLLYLFTFTAAVSLLIVLYAVLSIMHVAHEAPKNVLIAELYSHQDWERSFAFYEGFTEVGWLIGLLLGFVLSTFGVGPVNMLLVCSGLNLVAFVLSLLLVKDPALIFERGLVSIEKTLNFASRGMFLASKIMDGVSNGEKLKKENMGAFGAGLVLFSLATSILFTPMPIFVSNVVRGAGLPEGVVFAIFVLNSGGAIVGYAFAGSRSSGSSGKRHLGKVVVLRGFLTFLLIVTLQITTYSVGFVTGILILMGFAYAMFLVYALSLSMELIPAGKAGLFNVLIGTGGALGSFLGPFIAQTFGFFTVFMTTLGLFIMTYVAFKLFR
jgi:MFS family permease